MTDQLILEWIKETCDAYCIPKPFAICEALEAARAPTDRSTALEESAAICQRLAVEALDSYTTEAGRTAAHGALICAMGEIRNLKAGSVGVEQSTDAARDVLAERRRQIDVECWAPGRDDYVHEYGELADAAACYAHHSGMRSSEGLSGNLSEPFTFWPWASEWWKPTTPRRDLVKAGALILAEIERLDRLAAIESREKTSKLVQIEPPLTRCAASRDGECFHAQCPQTKDGEPVKSGRHCPIDNWGDDD